MLTRWQFWLLTLLAVVSVGLIGASMFGVTQNRAKQAEIGQRAQFIQQSVPLEALNREIVTALAQLAVRAQDEQLRSMLAGMGITMTESAAAAPQATSSTAPPAPARKK